MHLFLRNFNIFGGNVTISYRISRLFAEMFTFPNGFQHFGRKHQNFLKNFNTFGGNIDISCGISSLLAEMSIFPNEFYGVVIYLING